MAWLHEHRTEVCVQNEATEALHEEMWAGVPPMDTIDPLHVCFCIKF